jgi:hypothetical protein
MDSTLDTIQGLYVAFYHRAADEEGLNYWLDIESNEGDTDYIYALADMFSQHPRFEEEYGSLSDEEFVKAVYQNILDGVDDNQEAIDYWTDRVEAVGKDGMVAEFVKAVLEYDGDDAQGLARQEFFTNRIEAAKAYTETMGEDSNPINLDDLDSDMAYVASQAVIESVTDEQSLEEVLNFIDTHDSLEEWQGMSSLDEDGESNFDVDTIMQNILQDSTLPSTDTQDYMSGDYTNGMFGGSDDADSDDTQMVDTTDDSTDTQDDDSDEYTDGMFDDSQNTTNDDTTDDSAYIQDDDSEEVNSYVADYDEYEQTDNSEDTVYTNDSDVDNASYDGFMM